MKYQEGFVYHIKDSYFEKVQDDNLMRNKEAGTYRPTFFCMSDKKIPGLLWVVPMSTKIEKYQAIHDKQIAKYGKCLSIVLDKYDGKQAAFLLQNMFPITEQYLDHIHTRNGNPIPVNNSTAKQVRKNFYQLRQLVYKGKPVVYPDIKRLEQLMIEELKIEKNIKLSQQQEQKSAKSETLEKSNVTDTFNTAQKPSIEEYCKTLKDYQEKDSELERC